MFWAYFVKSRCLRITSRGTCGWRATTTSICSNKPAFTEGMGNLWTSRCRWPMGQFDRRCGLATSEGHRFFRPDLQQKWKATTELLFVGMLCALPQVFLCTCVSGSTLRHKVSPSFLKKELRVSMSLGASGIAGIVLTIPFDVSRSTCKINSITAT